MKLFDTPSLLGENIVFFRERGSTVPQDREFQFICGRQTCFRHITVRSVVSLVFGSNI